MSQLDQPSILAAELVADEHLIWQGRPNPAANARSFAIWIFAIPWTVFSIGWEMAAFLPWMGLTGAPDGLRLGFGIVMPIFGLPFILVGLGMLAKPFLVISAARKTLFAVTNRRLIRLETGRRRRVLSVFIDRVGPIETTERKDGWGDLRIQTHSTLDSEGDRTTQRFDMIGVPEVAKVRRLIVEHQPCCRSCQP